jgi:hypothetical protein
LEAGAIGNVDRTAVETESRRRERDPHCSLDGSLECHAIAALAEALRERLAFSTTATPIKVAKGRFPLLI